MAVRRRRIRNLLLCALAGGSVFVKPLRADTTWISNGNTTWSNAANWTPAVMPDNTTVATFSPWGGSANPSLDAARSVLSLNLANNNLFGDYTFGGNFNLTVGGASSTGITLRALGTTAFNGPTITGGSSGNLATLNMYNSATMALSGTSVASSNIGAITLRGGAIVLDNSAGNPSGARFSVSSASTPLSFDGGGNLTFLGNSAGSTFAVGGNLTGNTGDGVIAINQPSGATAATVVTFDSLTRAIIGATVDFKNLGDGVLGGGANNPTIKFNTVPSTASGANSGSIITTASGKAGFAIYNGTDFAAYSTSKGVFAVNATSLSGGSLDSMSDVNANLTGNASIAKTVSFLSLKISPSASGQSISITSAGTLNTTGILLPGTTDYSITGGVVAGSTTRYIYITNPNTTLSVSSNFAATNQSIVKSGDGFLALTGSDNQVGFNQAESIDIFGGTLRATTTNLNLTSTFSPTVRFRGGVLEYNVTSGNVGFTHSLGTGAGQVNWSQTGTPDQSGSGGFSAFSSGVSDSNSLIVNLGGSNAPLTWGGQTGSDLNFLQDGYALVFGSTKSNRPVTFVNPINLDNGSAGNYQLREIRVIAGTGGDNATINQPIAGSSSTDLFKTGAGTLVLTANNSYAGNTIITAGTLALTSANNNISSSAKIFVASAATLNVSGISNGFKLAANQTLSGSGTIRGNFTADDPSSTVAPGDAHAAGALTFTNDLNLTGGKLNIELGGTNPGTNYDQIIVSSTATKIDLTGATLSIAHINNFIPSHNGQTFKLIDNQSSHPITGVFANLAQGSILSINNVKYQLDYAGGDGNDFVLTTTPEPTTITSVILFCVFVIEFRSRKFFVLSGKNSSKRPEFP